MNKNLAVLLLALAAGCSGTGGQGMYVPPMDPTRKISEQDCSGTVEITTGNLMCMSPEAAAVERRRRAEEEQQRKLAAERRAKIEAEERARLERERAEQAAREEAARKARAAEEERLAAERKAREERERQEREAAEARARQLAEQQAREAAERQRLEQLWLEGRALLARFAATYGKVEEFKEVAEPITSFLDKTRNVKQ